MFLVLMATVGAAVVVAGAAGVSVGGLPAEVLLLLELPVDA